ncbi:hypothetical protein MANES_13G081278v8 [Manihot esculenta]|uniref:Uncharacterized protein n=1 Tax=Manihot esculenta TaxID=3983 RepID=A0ACB7GKF2_MANES|nr:hypothetical protein MANES_13G081278v8 [Manihot esculenta]
MVPDVTHISLHAGSVWQKPAPHWLKLNVDIATTSIVGWTRVGMVDRDVDVSFVAAKILRMSSSFSPLIAEVMGMREALSWIKEKDCKSLIQEISGNLLVSHVFRSANKVAHALAQATRLFPNILEWSFIPPNFVIPLLN